MEHNKNNLKQKLVQHLKIKKIETRDFFISMHNQPVLKKMKLIKKKDNFPISDYLEKNGIYIPSGPDIKKEEVRFIATTINNFLLRKF